MQAKLTLRLDDRLIKRAKAQAKARQKSVSKMVADYFAALDPRPEGEAGLELTPLVESLVGAFGSGKADREGHRRHLEQKHS